MGGQLRHRLRLPVRGCGRGVDRSGFLAGHDPVGPSWAPDSKLEALTGDRYMSIKNAFIGEADGDVMVVLDLDGCVASVELT